MQAKAHGRWELMAAPHLSQSLSAISDATSGALSPRRPLVPVWGGGGGLGGGRPRGRQGLAAVARCRLRWQRWRDGGSTYPSWPGFGAGGVLRDRTPGLGHGWWHCRSGWGRALGWKESRGSWCWLWVWGGLISQTLTLHGLTFADGVVGWWHRGFGGRSGHLCGKRLGAHLGVPRAGGEGDNQALAAP